MSTFEKTRNIAAQSTLSLKIAKSLVHGNGKINTLKQGLEVLGAWGAAAIKRNITNGIKPKNAQSTIDKKKSSKPLVDTGRLVNAITYSVED